MAEREFVKSSYSTSGGECVEVARNIPGTVAVRDSKAGAGAGPVVVVGADSWAAFVGAVVSSDTAAP